MRFAVRDAGALADGMAWGADGTAKPQGLPRRRGDHRLSILIGAFIGIQLGQPSAGTVIGTAVGIAIAVMLYVYDRRRG